MQLVFQISLILAIRSIVQSNPEKLKEVGECLRDLVTQELSNSYNYLQLSIRSGTATAYPGFSSFFLHLSDDDTSKAHDIVKYLTIRKFKVDRLINDHGIKIHWPASGTFNISTTLTQAHTQNNNASAKAKECHEKAAQINDGDIQNYLESHLFDHHIKIEKLLSDFQHRINDAEVSEKNVTIFMLDEELLNTYGDPRKDLFS